MEVDVLVLVLLREARVTGLVRAGTVEDDMVMSSMEGRALMGRDWSSLSRSWGSWSVLAGGLGVIGTVLRRVRRRPRLWAC